MKRIGQSRGCFFLVLSMAFLFTVTGAVMAEPYTGRLGAEAPGDAFVDVVKESYRWDKPDGSGGWTAQTAADVDADGWPKTDARWINDWRPTAEWFGSIDDPEVYRVDRSGVYKGSFTGQATLNWLEGPFSISNQVYNSGTNTTTFDLTIGTPGPHHGLIVMSFTNTKRTPTSATGSGITNFKLIRPGYAADTTQVFRNEYINCLTSLNFSAFRFMCLLEINNNVEWDAVGPILQSWTNRKKMTDAGQNPVSPLNKKDGWAYEYIIDVCNLTDMDLWLNIPVAADDNYIQNLAQLVYNRLEPERKIYLEHSNEVWNWGFMQYSWNKAKANAEVQAGGSNFNYDGSTNEEVWGQRRHAKRTRDIVMIFANVFGTNQINNRIRGVLAGFVSDDIFKVGDHSGMLNYLNANYGAPSGYIWCIADPTYFGGDAAFGNAGTENYTVDQILDGMRADSDGSRSNRQSQVTLAQNWSLPGGFCSYEGGPDTGGGNTANVGNRILAHRAVRMRDEYKRNIKDNFFDLGGNLAMQFTLAGSASRYGFWGMTDDVSIPDRNYKYWAIRDLIGVRSGVVTPTPTSSVPATPTLTPTPTLSPTSTPTLSPTATPTVSNGNGTGLKGEYYDNTDFTSLKVTRTDATVNFDWGTGSPDVSMAVDTYSIRWTGQVQPRYSETYTFYTNTDDGVRLWINNQLLVDKWVEQAPTEWSGSITLSAGVKYDLKMEYYENGGGALAKLSWSSASQVKEIIPQSQLYPPSISTSTPTATPTPTVTSTMVVTATPTATVTPSPTITVSPSASSGVGYKYYRLWIDSVYNPSTANCLQLAEIELKSGGVDRATGGNITASGEYVEAGETKEKAFDDITSNKWLTFQTTNVWIAYQFGGGASYAVNEYTLTSGNDYPERDPRDWQLQGSNDGQSWTTVDTRTGETFTSRGQTRIFAVSSSGGGTPTPTASPTVTPTTTPTPVVVKVNFQLSGAPVPGGYLADTGSAYGDRGNGYAYGWNTDNSANSRDREAHTDQRYDTLIHMERNGTFTWEIALNNGSYTVHLVCGDSSYTDQINNINIEGVILNDPDGNDNFDEYTVNVTVNDGKLSLAPATGGSNAKICFIEISGN